MDLQLILIPIVTVSKVLLVALVGGVVGAHVYYPQHSVKGISIMTVKIFLPAMLFSRMAIDMDLDLLRGGYGWAILLCFVPLSLGYSLAHLLRRFVDKELHGLFYLASTFQNALAFGLGLCLSLSGPKWIDASAYSQFTTVVFMYNLPHSLAMWSWGTRIVRHAKEDEVRSEYEKAKLTYEYEVEKRKGTRGDLKTIKAKAKESASESVCSVSILISPTTAAPSSPQGTCAAESPRCELTERDEELLAVATEENGDGGGNGSASEHPAPGISLSPRQSPTRVRSRKALFPRREQSKKVLDEPPMPVPPVVPSLPPEKHGFEALKEFVIESLSNITVLASLVGMAVGLIAPLKFVATETPVGRIFLGAAETLGAATIPLTLLQLGTSLTSAQKTQNPKQSRMIVEKQTQTLRDEVTGQLVAKEIEIVRPAPSRGFLRDYMDSLEIPVKFVVLATLIRLVIIPSCFLVIFLLLRSAGDIPILGPLPKSKVFQIPLMIVSCTPTAVNTSNLCAMFNYRATAYAQALFAIYVASVFTTPVWLTLYLWILGDE